MLLADALMDMGVRLKTPCGGKGTCGKCEIQIQGTVTQASPDSDPVSVNGNCLACRTYLHGDTSVYLKETLRPIAYPFLGPPPDDVRGIAVDIGTTSVKIALVGKSGEAYLLDNFLNPQRRFGDDVISRIAAADDRAVHERLGNLIRKSIMLSITDALERINLPKERISCISFSGNTTMLYLLLGIDVASLGRAPYTAPVRDFEGLAFDFGLSPHVKINVLPVHSAFLGADLAGGLAICDGLGYTENTFFIDLGTNGEIFLRNPHGEIFAASCAMGPALEGMNISCGMTADDGAITHVHDENGALVYEMLGTGEPAGICGTALIDLLSIFLKRGIINESGAMTFVDLPYPAMAAEKAGRKRIDLWKNITITQNDVRQVQLAKGASLAASLQLLKTSGCRADDIRQVVIAGALGEYLDLKNFRRLGFIPEFSRATYTYIGNTSLAAAARACADNKFSKMIRGLRDRIQDVKLVEDPDFQQSYLDSMSFSKEKNT
jgi:uncharacterized 2Fe-2S/4Fe-4S cluster protein (DUF4445 family)